LTGLGFVVLHHSHDNLRSVDIGFAGAEPVFAGDSARFRFRLTGKDASARYELELVSRDARSGPADVPGGGTAILTLTVPTTQRGWIDLPRCALETRHPANLCRAWIPTTLQVRCLVYPAPAARTVPVPAALDERHGTRATDHGHG